MVQATGNDHHEANPELGNDPQQQPFIERRAVGRALSCWDRLRETKEFPSRADCLDIFDEFFFNRIGIASKLIDAIEA